MTSIGGCEVVGFADVVVGFGRYLVVVVCTVRVRRN